MLTHNKIYLPTGRPRWLVVAILVDDGRWTDRGRRPRGPIVATARTAEEDDDDDNDCETDQVWTSERASERASDRYESFLRVLECHSYIAPVFLRTKKFAINRTSFT